MGVSHRRNRKCPLRDSQQQHRIAETAELKRHSWHLSSGTALLINLCLRKTDWGATGWGGGRGDGNSLKNLWWWCAVRYTHLVFEEKMGRCTSSPGPKEATDLIAMRLREELGYFPTKHTLTDRRVARTTEDGEVKNPCVKATTTTIQGEMDR